MSSLDPLSHAFLFKLIAFCELIYVFNDCDNMKHILKSKFNFAIPSTTVYLKQKTLFKYLLSLDRRTVNKGSQKSFVLHSTKRS